MDSVNVIAAPAVESALVLSGRFQRTLSLDLERLKGYESVLARPFDLRCYTTNRFIRSVEPYRGVRLTTLISEAGLPNEVPGEFKRTVFVAVGHDGYVVTFSWHELFNTPVGENVLVAYECDGRALNAEDGAPILFSGSDILPAPRHVKRLARIEAHVLKPLA
ncbi:MULTISPECIES: molybdopterin-dependent oxidoreductase [Paraburkholderia]|uniref:Molybdopterin-dependent oxidoreductase n=1 Tax=Paraburkholderia madseniana TaxID=2599607 RepID=A0AAP5EVC0_9BURK|nr:MULTISPECIES: molybdopterin-dependent oxidoreductase [Paraburkholderia]MCX4147052.1 molybdopterin-dependent oxidoreductase [Paraburkholderia madseniana]MDN7149995.1 molybdopterin-dependent oxidoreductase [Paraburkholderia sp. WS6]MDQ6408875.1 molybdopterin-dependent oxidoreductase [Paraburkholderia madseniana]